DLLLLLDECSAKGDHLIGQTIRSDGDIAYTLVGQAFVDDGVDVVGLLKRIGRPSAVGAADSLGQIVALGLEDVEHRAAAVGGVFLNVLEGLIVGVGHLALLDDLVVLGLQVGYALLVHLVVGVGS